MLKITKIEPQKRVRDRFSVFVDGEFAFGADGVLLNELKIFEGRELSPLEYDTIIEEAVVNKARELAIWYLGFRPRTEKEVAKKLAENGYSAEIAAGVTEWLKEGGYVDDCSYASDFVYDKFTMNGWGSRKIAYELKARGVLAETVTEAIDNCEVYEPDIAVGELEKKFRVPVFSGAGKQKMIDFLSRKGFPYDCVKEALIEFEGEFDTNLHLKD